MKRNEEHDHDQQKIQLEFFRQRNFASKLNWKFYVVVAVPIKAGISDLVPNKISCLKNKLLLSKLIERAL